MKKKEKVGKMEEISGKSDLAKRVLKYMDEDDQLAMHTFYAECLNRSFIHYEEIKDTPVVDNDALKYLQEYSSYNYININNALRNKWNYEVNGSFEQRDKFYQDGKKLIDIITKYQKSYGNFITYRGTNLNAFKEYGVSSLEDLKSLENTCLFDLGFISTSIVEEDCYFGKNYNHELNNIKIKYFIPEEFEDGIFLGNEKDYDITLFKKEKEYVINASNLAIVNQVSINKEENQALIEAVMIPKKIYDRYYRESEINNKKN